MAGVRSHSDERGDAVELSAPDLMNNKLYHRPHGGGLGGDETFSQWEGLSGSTVGNTGCQHIEHRGGAVVILFHHVYVYEVQFDNYWAVNMKQTYK